MKHDLQNQEVINEAQGQVTSTDHSNEMTHEHSHEG